MPTAEKAVGISFVYFIEMRALTADLCTSTLDTHGFWCYNQAYIKQTRRRGKSSIIPDGREPPVGARRRRRYCILASERPLPKRKQVGRTEPDRYSGRQLTDCCEWSPFGGKKSGTARFLYTKALSLYRGRAVLLCKSIAKHLNVPCSRPFGATEHDAHKLHAHWVCLFSWCAVSA